MTQEIVPFGKYKGQTLDEVAARDPGYLQWLQGQPWAREKFQNLIININNFGQVPEETPEHNRMQMRFLDEAYCRAVAKITKDGPEDPFKWIMWEWQKAFKAARRTGLWQHRYTKGDAYLKKCEKIIGLRKAKNSIRQAIRSQHSPTSRAFETPVFEVAGFDVRFSMRESSEWAGYRDHWNDEHFTFGVEIKPTIGDDFPAVLRQITRHNMGHNSHRVLLVGDYTGVGATLDQIRRFFKNSGVYVVMASEVEDELKRLAE